MRIPNLLLMAMGMSTSPIFAQPAIVSQPLVVIKPDKQFDTLAVKRQEGFLRIAVRLLDDPTFGPDAVRVSATPLYADTTRARRVQQPANAQGVFDFGGLRAGDYLVEGVRLGSFATGVVVRIRPGCHTYVEIYLTYQRFDLDAPTVPRATITACPDA